MPITFHCVHCGQHMSIATRMAGAEVPCPKCRESIVVPGRQSSPSDPPENRSDAPRSPTEDSGTTARPDWMSIRAPRPDVRKPDSRESDSLESDVPEAEGTDPAAIAALSPVDSDEVPPWELPPIDESYFESDDEIPAVPEPRVARPRRTTGRRRRPGVEDDEEMDLTSMVDVTFLLLVFFMITASFTRQKSFEIPPPDPEKKGAAQLPQFLEDIEEVSIRVAIDAENRVTVDDEPIPDPANLDRLFARLGRERYELLLESHEAALHETVVLVLDAAQDAGLQRIRMTMASAEGGE